MNSRQRKITLLGRLFFLVVSKPFTSRRTCSTVHAQVGLIEMIFYRTKDGLPHAAVERRDEKITFPAPFHTLIPLSTSCRLIFSYFFRCWLRFFKLSIFKLFPPTQTPDQCAFWPQHSRFFSFLGQCGLEKRLRRITRYVPGVRTSTALELISL